MLHDFEVTEMKPRLETIFIMQINNLIEFDQSHIPSESLEKHPTTLGKTIPPTYPHLSCSQPIIHNNRNT